MLAAGRRRRGGGVGRGLHQAARTVAELGLPVVHPQLVDRVAEPELVRARELRQVARERVGALVALDGVPAY